MQQRVQFCTTEDGVQIAYAVTGSGYPLLLIPGWVSHLEMDLQGPTSGEAIAGLAESFTVIRYDKRGTGLSERNVGEFGLAKRLLDVEALVSRLQLERFAVRGVSEGGPVAIAFAARHPERVSHLILQGTFAHLGHTPAGDALVTLIEAEWGLGSETMTNIFVPSAGPELRDFFARYQRDSASKRGAAAMLRANLETDVRELLPLVSAPTLVIHSETDRAIPFEHARYLAASIANASLATYKGDHAPINAIQPINEMIRDFVLGAREASAATVPQASGLLTIMFTDIERNTELLARMGDAAWRELLREHERITRDCLKRYDGLEIKTIGDAFMASFASASSALECAIALQRTFDERNRTAAEPVRIRVGLNTGEPIAEDGDLFGASVTMASRICGNAEPGQILAANVVRELAAGKQFLFADHGDVVLRGFEDPVRLYELDWRARA